MNNDFADIIEANAAYANKFQLGELAAPAARGLAVLTCIDSRIEPLAMLGLEPGDAKIIRNAGARATDDAIRSLVLATNLLEVNRIVVIAHTDCALGGTTDEEVRAAITESHPEHRTFGDPIHAAPDQSASLRKDMQRIRACELLPGGIQIGGFMYDVTTGLLQQVD